MLSLNDREWRPFFLTEIFPTIQRGKRLKSEDHVPGKMPYVSSSATALITLYRIHSESAFLQIV